MLSLTCGSLRPLLRRPSAGHCLHLACQEQQHRGRAHGSGQVQRPSAVPIDCRSRSWRHIPAGSHLTLPAHMLASNAAPAPLPHLVPLRPAPPHAPTLCPPPHPHPPPPPRLCSAGPLTRARPPQGPICAREDQPGALPRHVRRLPAVSAVLLPVHGFTLWGHVGVERHVSVPRRVVTYCSGPPGLPQTSQLPVSSTFADR